MNTLETCIFQVNECFRSTFGIISKQKHTNDSEAKDGLLHGNTNTYISQIGTALINDNKPSNLKQYKCDSCDFAVIQKGILTEHMTVYIVRIKNFVITNVNSTV